MSWLIDSYQTFRGYLWSDWFWLPHPVTWAEVQTYSKGHEIPSFLKRCLLVASILSVLRYVLTHFIFVPLGQHFGLRLPNRSSVSPNALLESTFSKTRRPSRETIQEMSEALNMDPKIVEFWFHKRRNLSKTPVILKFSESGWKFCFYTTMFFYGVYVLHDKDYLYDTSLTIIGYPKHYMPSEIHWYYVIELGYYLSELFWVFYGVRRSDFKVLVVHHMATIGLLSFSYMTNHHRIGAIILGLHDIADCWMESAKMFKYLNRHRFAEVLFSIFVGVWIITRLTYFPFWVIHAVFKYGYPESGIYPVYALIVGWLLLLQFMHVYWFCLIMNIVLQLKTKGEATQDCRSDSETSDELAYANGSHSPLEAKVNGFVLPDLREGDQTLSHRTPTEFVK